MTWKLKVEPRAWQREALVRWSPGMKGVASVVTGGGKTLLAYMCMLKCLETIPSVRLSIVVPSMALLDQWYVSLQDDLGVRADEIGLWVLCNTGLNPFPSRA